MIGSLKLRIRKKDIFFALLILTYCLRAYTDAVFVSKKIDSIWVSAKYVVLILAIVYGVCYVLTSGKKLKNMNVLGLVGATCGIFIFISFLKMLYTGVYSASVFKMTLYMFQSALTATLILNVGDKDDIYNFMRWLLFFCFSIYVLFEIGIDHFSIEYFKMISFRDSYSPFESHGASGTAVALCAYFCYHRKNTAITVFSFIFSLLIFKRLSVVFSILFFILPLVMDTSRKINKVIPRLCAAVFCIATVVFYWCLIPENQEFLMNILGVDSMEKFTSGRSGFLAAVHSDPFFVNFGWGSCEAYLGRVLELELIQMLIEVTFLGLVVFSFCYWEFAGTRIYGILYMGFHFLNLLTSHSLQNGFNWTLVIVSALQFHGAPYLAKNKHI